MKQLVNVNLTTKTAKDWTPPVLTFGEDLTLALRFTKNDDGSEIGVPLTVASLKAAVGVVDARPAGGPFCIKVGNAPQSSDNTTDFLDCNDLASVIKTRLNAISTATTYGAAEVISVPGSWLLFFGDQSQRVPLEVVNNGLWPVSLGRVQAWQVDGKWVHEIRLTQLPVAFTSAHQIVLPPAPVITRLQTGAADPDVNEIQQLYVPPEFVGAYIIKQGFAKTTLLSRDDGIDAIQEALQVFGANDFKVELPLSDNPTIEFIGDYAAAPQDLLVAEVKQSPPGDLTFTLQFDRAALASRLRGANSITLPMEIRITATDEGGFGGDQVALSLPITIQAPVSWPELEELPETNWSQPISPKTYAPYGTGEILTGNKYYALVRGDGAAVEFQITHGLNTEAVFVAVRENIDGGRMLVNGTDFSAVIDDANQVTITALTGAPDADAWFVMVIGAATVAAWANDLTVTVPQVIAGSGYPALPDFMDDARTRLAALEAVLPSTGPGVPTGSATAILTQLPKISEVLFLDGDFLSATGGLDPAKLPARAPFLHPAVHDADVDDLPDPLPTPATNAGKVYTNAGDAAVLIPGGGGLRAKYAPVGGFVACDGRSLIVANRRGTTNSYYPAAFEKTLFTMGISDKQLVIGRKLDIEFALFTQLAAGTRTEDLWCQAQWVLRLELGTYPSDTSPSPVGLNLQDVIWSDTPIFAQPILLDPLFRGYNFGVSIQRLSGGISLDQQIFGTWSGNNDAAPADANFVIRGKMADFDTEDSQPNARGFVYLGLAAPLNADGTVNPAAAVAKII